MKVSMWKILKQRNNDVCYLCGRPKPWHIGRSKANTLTNIAQNPPIKNFCSKDCKEKFIFHSK